MKFIRDELPEGSAVMSPEVVRALVAATHDADLVSVAHIGSSDDALLATNAGADVLAHMVYRDTLSDPLLAALTAKKPAVIATLHGFQATIALAEGTYAPSPLAQQLYPPLVTAPLTGEAGRAIADSAAFTSFVQSLRTHRPHWAPTLRALDRAGVPVLVGTDAPLPGVLPGASYHDELDALLDAGLPVEHVLLGATAWAADAFSDAPDYGALVEGRRADVLLLGGDPRVDPGALHRIEEIWQAGRRVVRVSAGADP